VTPSSSFLLRSPPGPTTSGSHLARRNGIDARLRGNAKTATVVARLKRTNTSFAVFCMRVFGLWSLRTAFAASLVSRNRFETYAVAPKTSSERILSSGGFAVDSFEWPYSIRSARTGANEDSAMALNPKEIPRRQRKCARSCQSTYRRSPHILRHSLSSSTNDDHSCPGLNQPKRVAQIESLMESKS
jgi:hypothetical protein